MIDAHVHFWQFDPVRDAWISEEMSVIRKDFLPEDWKEATDFRTPKGCVAVQADQSLEETHFLCQLAQQYPFIKGVVGWVDLLADDLGTQLEAFQQQKILKGFRHIAQAEGDDFLTRKEVLKGIHTLHQYGFTYDILVFHYQLPAVLTLLESSPQDQKFIIDHCAKPSIRNSEIETWTQQMKAVARYQNVYCKISGLFTEAIHNQWKTTDFFPYLRVVFEAFEADRVVFGSDWPVINLSADFLAWTDVLVQFFEKYPLYNSQGFWEANARKFYNM